MAQWGTTPVPPEKKPEVTPLAGGTPSPTHKQQVSSSENRSIISNMNYLYGTGSTTVVISPIITEVNGAANQVLKLAGKPQLGALFAPNETSAMIHVLQTNLGI